MQKQITVIGKLRNHFLPLTNAVGTPTFFFMLKKNWRLKFCWFLCKLQLTTCNLGKPLGTISAVQTGFDYGKEYFENDNGQTLFFDGILMDIMVDNGEI